jgi:hypothetical protein
MKHEIENEKLTENHSSKRIRIIEPEKYLTKLIIRRNLKIPNIFLIQNKGKGPPGRTRSPGLVDYLTRANQPAAFPKSPPMHCPEFIEGLVEGLLPELVEGNNTLNENELLIHTKPNYYSQLNFTIMKKHLFILILAVFAINLAWGQNATHGSIGPEPFTGTCSDDALHPIPGKAYVYDVTTNSPGSTYTWWATKDYNFITSSGTPPTVTTTTNMGTTSLTVAGGHLLSTSANYGQIDGSSSSVTITWSPQLLAGTASVTTGTKSPTFVAVLAQDAANCTNNFKVYTLDPKVAFTVDILPMLPTGIATGNYAATVSQCFSEVAGATFSPTTGGVDYNYGTNILYYEVVAANFTDEFHPSFKVDGLQAGQTAILEYSTTSPTASATWTPIGSTLVGAASSTLTAGTATVTVSNTENTTLGVSVYLRLTVNNGNWEGLADLPISVSVEATDKELNYDIDQASANCLPASPGYEDSASQTLTQRPTVTSNTPINPSGMVTFLPKN